uniref:Protein kinase domain-containing protein n=2 Tax=Graphocephala atropunctata TaxID=36148 RepID=A0A1B6M948_9HEMI
MFENAPSPGVDTIVMELLQGMDVLSHACSLSSISEAHVRRVATQLLSALDYLQLQQIVHCDIKPDNLLIENHNGQFQLKIVDFGSACSLSAGAVSCQPCLPPDLEFAAPELLSGPSTSPSLATDMWSCAVLIYVLVSGVSPFLDESPEETTAHVLNADFSFPPDLFPPGSAETQEFISSLLVLDSTSRPLARSALSHTWLQLDKSNYDVPPTLLASFVSRRKPQLITQSFVL